MMPSTTAIKTMNRKSAISASSTRCSATRQATFAAGTRLIRQPVMGENVGLPAGRQLAVRVDGWGVLDQLLRSSDAHVTWADRGLEQRREHQPVPSGQPDLNCRERRQVGRGVDVDRLELADLVVVGV